MGETATSGQTQLTTGESTVRISLQINGETRVLQIDPRTTLLDALREHLGLTGSKKACDQGQCGACTIHINGRRALSCLSLAIAHQRDELRTIEGLAEGDTLHPMQAAFLECDGFQCGYCTPGQIMSAVGMLEEAAAGVPSHQTPDVAHPPSLSELSAEEIRERMSGNICRCGAYPNIVEAIRQTQTWLAKSAKDADARHQTAKELPGSSGGVPSAQPVGGVVRGSRMAATVLREFPKEEKKGR